jgi:DNA-binding transcriptional LysR family regulator
MRGAYPAIEIQLTEGDTEALMRMLEHDALDLALCYDLGLACEPFILINLPHSREYFLSVVRNAAITPRIAHESASLEIVSGLVALGRGVAVERVAGE